MTVQSATNPYSAVTNPAAAATTTEKAGFGGLDQQDFFRLLTTQMQMQDPFDPVDNKEMLAQMAQFSSLAGISEMGETLTAIAKKLDALIAQQQLAGTATQQTTADATTGSASGTDGAAADASGTAGDATAAATETQTETQTPA